MSLYVYILKVSGLIRQGQVWARDETGASLKIAKMFWHSPYELVGLKAVDPMEVVFF